MVFGQEIDEDRAREYHYNSLRACLAHGLSDAVSLKIFELLFNF